MATNQMEEMLILRARDKALGAIIERYPFTNLCVEGDGIVLQVVVSEGSTEALALDAEQLRSDWEELIKSLNDLSHYSLAVPDYGYHWVDKTYRRDWFLSKKPEHHTSYSTERH